jgi:glycine hydroxymethyltransferase
VTLTADPKARRRRRHPTDVVVDVLPAVWTGGASAPHSPGIADLFGDLHLDAERCTSMLNLTANENVLSDTARRLLSSPFADRYLIGRQEERGDENSYVRQGLLSVSYPGIDALEQAASRAACLMFGGGWVDFRPLSGLHAATCTFAALTRPGSTVWSIDPRDGGHFATSGLLSSLGRRSRFIPWDPARMTVDLEAFADAWSSQPGAMIFLDHGVPLRPLPTLAIRQIVGNRATVVYDASHTLGLIAGSRFQAPLAEGCDVLQGNTHKSFPGAHKGIIVFADEATGRRVSKVVGEALVSSQQTGATLANYVTTLEMAEHARSYAGAMLTNCQMLGELLADAGFRLHTPADGGSPSASHVLVLSAPGRDSYRLAADLVDAGIGLNARPVDGTVALRIGVQEITRRSIRSSGLRQLAGVIGDVAEHGVRAGARGQITDLARNHRAVHFSFDHQLARDETKTKLGKVKWG